MDEFVESYIAYMKSKAELRKEVEKWAEEVIKRFEDGLMDDSSGLGDDKA